MVVKEYNSLDEILKKGIKEIILEEPYFSYKGMNCYLQDLFITSNSLDISVDLGDYLYTMKKWNQLLDMYVDKQQLVEFAEILKKSKSYAQTFYFKQKSRRVGHGNGSCLVSFVITRPDRNKPFNKATVTYRTTVLTKQFVCDLILANKLAKYLNENTDGACDITYASFYAPVASVNAFQLSLYYKNFKLNVFKHKDNYICKRTLPWIEEFINGERKTKFKSFQRLIDITKQGGCPSLPCEGLFII